MKRKLTIDPMPRQDLAVPPPIGYVARADYDALTAEVDRLREALKPFANYAKSLKGWESTEAVCSEIGLDFERVVTAGDFFAARTTLKGQQP